MGEAGNKVSFWFFSWERERTSQKVDEQSQRLFTECPNEKKELAALLFREIRILSTMAEPSLDGLNCADIHP